MSLFGGSAPPPPSSYESTTSSSSSARSSPSVEEIPDPRHAQEAQTPTIPVPLDVNDDLDTDSESARDESDGEDDDDEVPVRPNRFTGPPQTWQSYTEADRQIADSLDQLQETDLAVHLYNAHALKRRLRRLPEDNAKVKNWQNRDNWLKTGQDLEYVDAAGFLQTAIVPSKEWTAWPIPPDEEPPSGHVDEWTAGSANTGDAGDELREELLAVFLRLAKEKWNSRETPSSDSDAGDHMSASRSRSRSRSAGSAKPKETTKVGTRTDDVDDGNDAERDRATGKKRGRKPRTETLMEPTLLADDARAQRLLQPTIQNMMGKLDELALAIRRTRVNHFGRGGPGDSSMSEYTSGAESNGPRSRSTSRARSKSATSRRSSTRPLSRATSTEADRTVRQKTKAARKATDEREPANDDDISSGGSDWEKSNKIPRERKRRRSSSTMGDGDSSGDEGILREGLLDWSEVLGLAAVQGWNEGAIARTAQRCATLFGEGMSFMPFHEALASKAAPGPVSYTPSTIPPPVIPSISQPPPLKRPFFQIGTLRCPHADCWGHEKDFALAYRVVEHCMRVHKYDPRTNDSDNEERTIGGVHIDGFLQPITAKQGWLGNGRAKAGKASKRARTGQSSSSRGVSEAALSAGEE
ncbi:hypothetical protein J4E93_001466 [Alternaria ventricosa]|uniref:uncharacterized protein n=1 Tax=Alternaria ventricosa TaxID=1187951 RepID=UPI0020C3B355|nr:uncharacterized protein J4E93_001466 [Alternaria ventricosa]KAI4653699.1 hypothetical protein J4E93_001466 [Alternaria ventricosa]